MIGSRAWRALMRRNLIYRKRNWIGTIFDIGLPVLFLGLLVLIKEAVEDNESFASKTVPEFFPTNQDTFKALSFQDYVTAMQAQRECVLEQDPRNKQLEFWISGIQNKGRNWQVPFVKCDSRKCERDGEDAQLLCEYSRIAVSGSSADDTGGQQRALDFQQWIYDTYPDLLNTTKMPFDFEFVKEFKDPQKMDQYVKQRDYGTKAFPKITMGIVFEGNETDNFIYSLRQNSTNFNAPEEEARPAVRTTPDTAVRFASFAKNDKSCEPEGGTPDQGEYEDSCTGQYMYSGVLTIQRLVGDFILEQTGAAGAGYRVAESGVTFVQFPAKEYLESGFYAQIKSEAPLLVCLGFLYSVAAMIGYVVREKELRQKELMKMMSVTESDIGWAWWTSFYGFHFITAAALTGLSTLLYTNSEVFYLWVFWILSMLAIVVFALLFSSFFSKSVRAVVVGLLVFLIGMFLPLIIDYQDSSGSVTNIVSLHPIAAIGFGIQEIGSLEDLGVGLNSETIGSSDYASGYTFRDTLRLLLIDSLLWGVVTWYMNRVIPPDYGQAEPWWFPVRPLLRLCSTSSDKDGDEESSDDFNEQVITLEPVGDALRRQSEEGTNIQIRGLRKNFGDKIAVDGLNLSMYNGQVTALLGHNGAGKTTAISILTGALAPTDGYAKIKGKDIRTDMNEIRKDIGICLQHDCLFPRLTAKEHLQFFARLKGLYNENTRKEAEDHIDQALHDVALFEKRNTFSKNLSGGMKRKLSVAIAFCGGSKVVLLDEPTSGMDPFSRRFTWNVIRQYRQDRCIILTTHFMDEADILGDRIAIMSEGQLRCCGSSLFLKKTYGVGYQLTIEKYQRRSNDRKATVSKEDTTDMTDSDAVVESENGSDALEGISESDAVVESENGSVALKELSESDAIVESENRSDAIEGIHAIDDKLEQIVKSGVSEAVLLTNVGSEMSFQLPMGAASRFSSIFEGLDNEIEKGTISSYGVSITTLDEVFLLVARGETTDKKEYASSVKLESRAAISSDPNKSARSRMDLEKQNLFHRHVRALFRKRAANFKRDKKAWFCTAVLPGLFVLVGFLLFQFVGPDRDLEPVLLSLEDYNQKIESEVRNPIVVNSPDSPYTCQPGQCAYQTPVIERSDEKYYFCGYQARLADENASCTISASDQTIGRLTGTAGVSVQPATVETVFNSSLSLFASADDYPASQYGAIFFTHELDSTVVDDGRSYNESVIQACFESFQNATTNYSSADNCIRFGGYGYVIQYNFTALHVTPLFQTLADEALVREALDDDDFRIQCTISPLPITEVEEGYGAAEDAFPAWFLIVLSFPFIAAAFATFVVMERQSKAKHLQTVAGVEPSAYWLSTWLWDLINYQIPLWLTVIFMFAFGVDVLTTTERGVIGGVLALLILYGPASAGFSYCVSFAFESASLVSLFLIIFNFLISLGGSIAVFILILIGEDPSNPRPELVTAAKVVTWILRFVPSFCLGKGLYCVINMDFFEYNEGKRLSAWSEPILLVEVIFLAAESIIYPLLAVQIDKWSTNPRAMAIWKKFIRCILCKCFCDRKRGDAGGDLTVAIPDDDDVIAEQQRVLLGEANDDLVVISQLTKVYDNGQVAVKDMSLGIPHGECFGLLGINGAGKTTTMGMLTCEFPPTSGDATLAGFSVTKEPEKTRRRIGYCPQFDALFANMTGREHVELYASIKGIPVEFVKESAALKLQEVGLSEKDVDRLAAGYSGGMKRRLSLACAMIGQPQIVFLDECSTGVDPVARREIWQLISDMVSGENIPDEEKTSVVLTTHSMEECEALCPRIGIMANGRLRCLGSAQHLKNKFGQGFQIEMKIKLIDKQDEDYVSNAVVLAQSKGGVSDEEVATGAEDIFFNLEEALAALRALTGDNYLSDMVNPVNPAGYSIFKNASAGMEGLDELAAFATSELRMRNLETFIIDNFSEDAILRERQDTKARYEVPSEGIRIAYIFASIEENKEKLMLADYGVSQTSLEQVFNMHAAEAEKLKQGRDDR